MPCPLFEPQFRVQDERIPAPRLPLIHEYEGICHAGEALILPEHRFHYCNRGNAKGHCARFPAGLAVSAIRFSVISRTASVLALIVVEEQEHWPGAWQTVEFHLEEKRLCPEITDLCRRAQIRQFCESYLEAPHATNTR